MEGRLSARSNFRDASQKSASRRGHGGIAHLLAFFTCDSRSRERIHFSCISRQGRAGLPGTPGLFARAWWGPRLCRLGVVLFPLACRPPGANSGNDSGSQRGDPILPSHQSTKPMAEEEGEEVEPPKNGKFIFLAPRATALTSTTATGPSASSPRARSRRPSPKMAPSFART